MCLLSILVIDTAILIYLAPLLQILVSCTKGILNDSLETPQQILSRVLPAARNLAYLSGPSFAAEVAAGQPTVVTIASANDHAASRAQMLLSNSRFRCYRTNDVEGRVHHSAQKPTKPIFPCFCHASCCWSLVSSSKVCLSLACRNLHPAEHYAGSFAQHKLIDPPHAAMLSLCVHLHHNICTCNVTVPKSCYVVANPVPVTGVEMGGALKNVLAIACGISDGLGFGNNARAALITRGLVEITRLAVASGAHPMTMGGLAGMGDLVLTCTGMPSSSFHLSTDPGR